MQQAAAASEVGLQRKVAERFEPEQVLKEEFIGAGGIRFELAGAPRVFGAEALAESSRDGGAVKHAFTRAE